MTERCYKVSKRSSLRSSEPGRDYGLGWRLTRGNGPGAVGLHLSLEVRRHERVATSVGSAIAADTSAAATLNVLRHDGPSGTAAKLRGCIPVVMNAKVRLAEFGGAPCTSSG